MSGLILNGDTSGSVTLNVPAVAGSSTVTLPSTTGNIPVLPTGYSLGAGDTTRFKNRIINGDMRIDQRNNGASVTIPAALTYTVDRWFGFGSQASKFTVQQNAASVTPPVGFTNYLGCTSSSAYTVGSSESFRIHQAIEGYNVSDLRWGTTDAKTVTLSFWVRSSLTGSFGASVYNDDATRVYPFNYTISSANTWTQISVTIPGDTSGTWNKTNSAGIRLQFSLGAGSTFLASSSAWGSSLYFGLTGTTSVVGTSGATFYVTGVQLEVGSQATSFEYVDYANQLVMCQRYYSKSYDMGSVPGATGGNGNFYSVIQSGTATGFYTPFKVNMRTAGTFTVYSTFNGASGFVREGGSSTNVAVVYGNVGETGAFFYITAGSAVNFYYGQYTINAEL